MKGLENLLKEEDRGVIGKERYMTQSSSGYVNVSIDYDECETAETKRLYRLGLEKKLREKESLLDNFKKFVHKNGMILEEEEGYNYKADTKEHGPVTVNGSTPPTYYLNTKYGDWKITLGSGIFIDYKYKTEKQKNEIRKDIEDMLGIGHYDTLYKDE